MLREKTPFHRSIADQSSYNSHELAVTCRQFIWRFSKWAAISRGSAKHRRCARLLDDLEYGKTLRNGIHSSSGTAFNRAET
jgi:hypothetical protein